MTPIETPGSKPLLRGMANPTHTAATWALCDDDGDLREVPRRLHVTVPGIPQPQGSVRSLGKGRPSIHGNAERLLPWRASVTAHCQQAMRRQGGVWPLSGPLSFRLTLVLPRPASAPKSRLWPDKRPDLSHLLRACEDAITASGAWSDDSQVCRAVVEKQWPDAMWPGPCAVIEIQPIGGQE